MLRALTLLFLGTLGGANPIGFSLNCIQEMYDYVRYLPDGLLWGNGNPIGKVATYDNATYVCFRGTIGLLDWLSDFQTDLVPYPKGGRVHRGVWDLLRQPYHLGSDGYPCLTKPMWGWCVTTGGLRMAGPKVSILSEVLRMARGRTYVSGHSLGAALATLVASEVPESVLYAFASPKVGDPEFADGYDRRVPESYLVYLDLDIVPQFPISCYRHVGRHVRLKIPYERIPRDCDIHWYHSLDRFLDIVSGVKGSIVDIKVVRKEPSGKCTGGNWCPMAQTYRNDTNTSTQ